MFFSRKSPYAVLLRETLAAATFTAILLIVFQIDYGDKHMTYVM
jgi:hypothetical protein